MPDNPQDAYFLSDDPYHTDGQTAGRTRLQWPSAYALRRGLMTGESMDSHDHEQLINRMPAPDIISLCFGHTHGCWSTSAYHSYLYTMATSEPALERQKSREGLDLELTERSAKPKPSTSRQRAASKSSRRDQNLAMIPTHSKNKSSLRIRSSNLAIKRIALRVIPHRSDVLVALGLNIINLMAIRVQTR